MVSSQFAWQTDSDDEDEEDVIEGWYATPRPSSAPPELASPSKHRPPTAALDNDEHTDQETFAFPFVNVPDNDIPSTPRKNVPISSTAPRLSGVQPSPVKHIDEVDDSDDSLDPYSSPHVGSKATLNARARARGVEARRATMLLHKDERKALRLAARQRAHEKERVERENKRREREEALRSVSFSMLAALKDAGFTLREFLLLILDPAVRENDLGQQRATELYQNGGFVDTVLGYWTTGGSSGSSSTVVERTTSWMTTYIAGIAAREAAAITRGGLLQVTAGGMTKSQVLTFEVADLYPHFAAAAPVMLEICMSFATSRRQLKVQGAPSQKRRETIITYAVSNLLRQHSRANSLVANYHGLYLYATGAQRQTISVLSHAGYTCSYTTLVKKLDPRSNVAATDPPGEVENTTSTADEPVPVPKGRSLGAGILPTLSASCMQDAQRLAKTGEYEAAYDNVNMDSNIAQQTAARIDSILNMTAATAVDLNPRTVDPQQALSLASAEASFLAAGLLGEDDIIFSPEEAHLWVQLNISTIEHAILDYGEGYFSHFKRQIEAADPHDELQLEVFQSAIHPLQTMDINEASITGNIEVVDAIHVQLAVDLDAPDEQRVRLLHGDQLTVSRIHHVVGARAGHESGAEGWRWAKPIPALFHTDMSATTCVLTAHWGKQDTGGERDPGALWFHNTVLLRKPIVLSSLPPYHVCRDLLNVSMNARILHCLLKVTDQPDLAACARSILTYDELHAHACELYQTYASIATVAELRDERRRGGRGDKVFENGSLFLRDTVGLRTFRRAVKSGRSGHIILALKWLALMFKAGGHPKYAREMLYLIHHLVHVWPKKLRDLILKNWLVNPTGSKNGWVALDHMQEHLNFWIKKVYAAHGSNSSAEWLAMISPCVDVLRKVAHHVHIALGSYQGRKHTSPDLTRDIRSLMASLAAHAVYERGADRAGVDEAKIDAVPDLWGVGLQLMTDGTNATLTLYNAAFATLQKRARVKPLEDYVPQVPAVPNASQTSGGQGSGAEDGARAVSGAVAPMDVDNARSLRTTAGGDAADVQMGDGEVLGDDAARNGEENGSDASSEYSAATNFEDEPDEPEMEIQDELDVELDPDSIWDDYNSDLDDP